MNQETPVFGSQVWMEDGFVDVVVQVAGEGECLLRSPIRGTSVDMPYALSILELCL